MGNRRAREFVLRQADEEGWGRARTLPRPVNGTVGARGCGGLRLQLVVCPSFEEGVAWEVRQRGDEWFLYRSAVVGGPTIQLVGFDWLSADPLRLAGFYARVTALTLPLSPDRSGLAGADGTSYQLAVYGDLWSGWRFQWWSEYPRQWQPIVDLADEMAALFGPAPLADAPRPE
jgi:hypothetical protein